MALVGAGHVAPGRATGAQAGPVQMVDDCPFHGQLAGRELDVAEGILDLAQLADRKALADDQDTPPSFA